jgi:hypothetical protein
VDIQQLIHKLAVKTVGGTVEVAGGVEDALRPKSKKFSAGCSVRSASPGLQPKACIQNDGNS